MNGVQDTYKNEDFDFRENKIPLRPTKDHKVISIFGITGSGKTIFLRKVLGFNPDTEKIPPTSANRTTTYNFEAVVTNEPLYKFCITLSPFEYIEDIITECLFNATREYYTKKDINKAFKRLLEDSSQTFRLKYIIGDLKPTQNDSKSKKYTTILNKCLNEYSELCKILRDDSNQDVDTKFEDDGIIHDDFIKSKLFISYNKTICDDVISAFRKATDGKKIQLDNMKSKDNRWPNGCFYSTRSREEFIETLHAAQEYP